MKLNTYVPTGLLFTLLCVNSRMQCRPQSLLRKAASMQAVEPRVKVGPPAAYNIGNKLVILVPLISLPTYVYISFSLNYTQLQCT